jgi:hypothetical protein
MADSSDILVEIPPPEVSPAVTNWWSLALVSLAMLAGVVVFALATAPRIPPLEWLRVTGPAPVNLDSAVATPDGYAMLSGMTVDGVLLWWSEDGIEWVSQPLRETRTQLAVIDGGLFAYGDTEGHMLLRDGDRWVEEAEDIVLPDEIRSRQSSGRPSIVGTGRGMVAMSILGDVWWSADGADFELVIAQPKWGTGAEVGHAFESRCEPPSRTSPDVPPMMATADGLFALVSSNPAEPFGIWPVCEPEVWVTDDGREWAESAAMVTDGGYVYDVGWHDGEFVAVGGHGIGQPAVWTSSDGLAWEQLSSFDEDQTFDLYTLASGPAGWVILGQTEEQSTPLGWVSRDGECWEALPWEVAGSDALVGTGEMLILDRTTYPESWHGSLTGGTGSC